MAHRALIIAIERYPQMTAGIAGVLPDTLKSGEDFRDWLLAKWDAEGVAAGDREVLFCSEPQIAGGHQASVSAIRDVLKQLRATGQNATEALYLFFSGHGFTFSDGREDLTDYLMTSESTGPDDPAACLPFDHLVTWLRNHLGPGRHFYFVDACRNVLTVQNADPGPLGLTKDRGAAGEPATFALQSTHQGAVAAVSTEFPKALLGGLKGAGKAKVYDDNVPNAMFVHYGSLRDYVKGAMRGQSAMSRATGDLSEREAVLATLKPVPTVTCEVRVNDVDQGDRGIVFVRRERGPLPRAITQQPMTGATTTLRLEPDRYSIGVSINGASVVPDSLVALDVFDDATAPAFTRAPLAAGEPAFGAVPPEPLPPPSPTPKMTGGLRGGLPPRADAAARSPSAAWDLSLAHRSIAAAFPHSPEAVDFSESLGWVGDADLNVWLAILGGGRILPQHVGDYSKIAPLPLYDFSAEVAGASPIYILAGFPEELPLEVSVADGVTPQWQPAVRIGGLAGVQHLHLPTAPGPLLLSIRLPARPTRTVVSLTSTNRATLVTLTIGSDGEVRLWQYLLPLGHLIDQLPAEVQWRVRARQNPLDDVRMLAAAGRAFRHRRDIGTEMPSDQLEQLFYAKWIDPIGSALAAYQALRQGNRNIVREVATNMLAAFPELPDSHALATLAEIAGAYPRGVPLFLDGLRAFPDEAPALPFAEKLLDMRGPWTAWRRAV
jgi:hypothetical protein